MPFPPVEPLYEQLCALRDAEDPGDPRHETRWREVARWLDRAFPGGGDEGQDARQETLLSLMRHVRAMRAEGPLQAAKWVATILRRKRVDALRAKARDPVQRGLRGNRRDDDAPSLLDRLETHDAQAPSPEMLQAVVTTVLEHVHRALEETERNAMKRELRRTQAQATLLRLVCSLDAPSIADVLEAGEPITKDRLYKWVERGRPVVHLGLARWEQMSDEDERTQLAPLWEALRELIDERRADAGVPRPDRRKDRPEDHS